MLGWERAPTSQSRRRWRASVPPCLRRYTLESFGELAEEAGLEVRRVTAWSALREERLAASGQIVATLTAR